MTDVSTKPSAFKIAGQGEKLAVLTDDLTPKTEGGALEVFEIEGPRDSGPPPHDHPWSEHFYVIEGEVDVTVADEQRRMAAGDFVTIPARTLHTFAVASERARFLSITEGNEAGKFFRDLSTLGHVVPDEEHLADIVTIAKRNGLTSPLFPG